MLPAPSANGSQRRHELTAGAPGSSAGSEMSALIAPVSLIVRPATGMPRAPPSARLR